MYGIGVLQNVQIQPYTAGDVVDTANFEGVLFVSPFAVASTATLALRHGDDPAGTDQAAVNVTAPDPLGGPTTGPIPADLTMDGAAFIAAIECHKPAKRYVSCTNTSATSVAILYAGRKPRVEQTGQTNGVTHVSPT